MLHNKKTSKEYNQPPTWPKVVVRTSSNENYRMHIHLHIHLVWALYIWQWHRAAYDGIIRSKPNKQASKQTGNVSLPINMPYQYSTLWSHKICAFKAHLTQIINLIFALWYISVLDARQQFYVFHHLQIEMSVLWITAGPHLEKERNIIEYKIDTVIVWNIHGAHRVWPIIRERLFG